MCRWRIYSRTPQDAGVRSVGLSAWTTGPSRSPIFVWNRWVGFGIEEGVSTFLEAKDILCEGISGLMAMVSHTRDDRDDSGIVTASLEDIEAFGELFRRHAPRLHAYISRRLGHTLADDLVSETFTTAFRQRDRFDGRADFGAWLWGIASNLIAKHHRRETRMYRAFARTGVDPPRTTSPSRPVTARRPRRSTPHLAKALSKPETHPDSARARDTAPAAPTTVVPP